MGPGTRNSGISGREGETQWRNRGRYGGGREEREKVKVIVGSVTTLPDVGVG